MQNTMEETLNAICLRISKLLSRQLNGASFNLAKTKFCNGKRLFAFPSLITTTVVNNKWLQLTWYNIVPWQLFVQSTRPVHNKWICCFALKSIKLSLLRATQTTLKVPISFTDKSFSSPNEYRATKTTIRLPSAWLWDHIVVGCNNNHGASGKSDEAKRKFIKVLLLQKAYSWYPETWSVKRWRRP